MNHDTTKSVNKQLISSKWKSSNGFAGGVNQNTVFSFSVAEIRSSVGRYDTKCRKMWGYVEQWFSMKSHKAFSHVDNYSHKKSWSIVSEGCNALYSNISHQYSTTDCLPQVNVSICWRKENSSFV